MAATLCMCAPLLLILSILASTSIAFKPYKQHHHRQHLLSKYTRQTLYNKQCTPLQANPHDHNGDSENHTTSSSFNDDDDFKFSKSKWKKKRYLMIQDVKRKIERNDPQAIRKAEEVVRRMQTLYEKSGSDLDFRPTLQAYNLWIHALAKSDLPNAGRLAENVIEQMRDDKVTPDVVSYSSVLDAYARSGTSGDIIEDVLIRLLENEELSPDEALSAITCDTILNVWAQQGTRESAQRAQTALHHLGGLTKADLKPTKISYTTVLNAWAKVGSAEAAEEAESLLNSMIRKSGENAIQPDVIVFNAAINAWAMSKDPKAGKRAFALFRQMKDLASKGYDTYPDIVTYNTILSAWSHSGDVNAAPQTEKIVNEMQKSAKESNAAPRPNTISYNTILDAWSKSTLPGAALRAQKVLQFMIQSKDEGIAPDVISFTSVLNAWAKSKEPHKSARTRALLDQLIELYRTTKRPSLRPTQISYNAVLNACAFSAVGTTIEEQREALQIAVSTFSEMRKSRTTAPDTVSYGNMIKCLANLMPQGEVRTSMALQIFSKCCDEGLVGNLVWNEVRRAVPSWELEEKFKLKGSCGNMQVKDLPKSWRNQNKNDKLSRQTPRAKTKETPEASVAPIPYSRAEASAQAGKDF